MKKLIFLFAIAFLFATTQSFGQTHLYTDSLGNTTGTIDGERVDLYTDRLGNTTGKVGKQRLSTYTDSSGYTSGSIPENSRWD